MKKILFISHDASGTGAPILLLRLIREIKKESNFEIIILLKNGGVLENDFKILGKTFIWNSAEKKSRIESLKERFLRRLNLKSAHKKQNKNISFFKEFANVDIIFNNTITNASLLKQIPLKGKKVFSYFHEMEVVTQMFATKEDVAFLNAVSEKIFVPSEALKNFLIKDYNIDRSKISFLKYIIPQQNNETADCKVDKTNSQRIGGSKFSVGFCGTLHWRKGFEFLPLLVKKIILDKNVRDIHFVWIGVNKHYHDFLISKNDLAKLNLESHVTFIEAEPDITRYLAQLDVLALPSREDAFPLVVLEAACYRVPCVYFLNSGGISEFCGSDAGIPIGYLDIDGMAEAIIQLKSNAVLKEALGQRAREKIIEYSNDTATLKELFKYFNISTN